jgi:S1-C subfamily serine protease
MMNRLIIITLISILALEGQSQSIEKLLNDNAFKISILVRDFSYPHGIDPPRELLLRKMYGKKLPKGSGFLYRASNGKKFLITCMHVVEQAKAMKNSISVTNGNGEKFTVKMVGGDTFYDIAVLEFTSKEPAAKGLNFSSLPVQLEQVIKPAGIFTEDNNANIKKSIISGRQEDFKEQIGGFGYWKMGLAIEKGMSGGPVFNIKNQVVGINSRVRMVNGKTTSTSYMLDGLIAKKAIEKIIKNKRIPRAFLGIIFEQQITTKNKIQTKVTINSLIKGYPASAYKVLKGYYKEKNTIVVEKINQIKILHLNDIYKALEVIEPRSMVKLTLSKNGVKQIFDIKANMLDGTALIKITEHYFKNNRYQFVKEDKNRTLIKDSKNGITFNAILAGNAGEKAYYVVKGKQEIGVIIRLCSELGSFSFVTWTEDEELKAYNVSNNNNDPRYTSYLLYF